jgi:hypothetical protein
MNNLRLKKERSSYWNQTSQAGSTRNLLNKQKTEAGSGRNVLNMQKTTPNISKQSAKKWVQAPETKPAEIFLALPQTP